MNEDGFKNMLSAFYNQICEDYISSYIKKCHAQSRIEDCDNFMNSCKFSLAKESDIPIQEIISVLEERAKYRMWKSTRHCKSCKERSCVHFEKENYMIKTGRNDSWSCKKRIKSIDEK